MTTKENAPALTGASFVQNKRGVMNNSSIVPQASDGFQDFDFNGIAIRGKLDENGDPIILAMSLCEALKLKDVTKALAGLPDNEKGKSKVLTPGGWQQVWHVTEGGMYRLIYRSNKSQAEQLRQKIFNEILPAIRKTGFYASPALSSLDVLKQMVNVLDEIQHKQGQMALQIEDITEELLDRDYHTVLQFCQQQHIAHTPALRQMWGKEAKALSRERGIEIKSADEGQYSVGRYYVSILIDVCRPKPRLHGQMQLIPGGGK